MKKNNRTPKVNKSTLSSFCKALKKHHRFLLSCHVSPEGDAIGSIYAMESLLRRLGKKTIVVSEDSFPKRLYCLNPKRWNRIDDVKSQKFDALVTADCPTLARIGRVQELLNPETVIFNIDHHVSNEYFGHYNYVVPEAAASGEVVYEIFKYFGVRVNKEDATNLYVALSTDTGSFKYGNTTVKSHLIAAELIKTGIDVEKINADTYATYSLNKINLYSRLLSRVKTTANGRLAWAIMKKEDLQQSGATYEDAEGFIDFLKYIREVQAAFFMIEMNNAVRVSFRSKDPYDVNGVATYFNGGGHKKASGCMIPVPLEEAEKMVLSRIKKEFRFS